MKRADKIKNIVLLALAVVSLGALAAFLGLQYSLAAYSRSYVKGVAATGSMGTQLISSNLLYNYKDSDAAAKEDSKITQNTISITPAAGAENTSIEITLSNFVQGYMSLHNTYDVGYTLTVTAKKLSDSSNVDLSKYEVKIKNPGERTVQSDTTGTCKLEDQNLRGAAAITHSFTINFPVEYINNVSFLVKVELDKNNNTGYALLAANLVPVQKVQASESLHGQLINYENQDDDAYTYEITLNGKEGKVRLSWPSDKVELDPYFYLANNAARYQGLVSEIEMAKDKKSCTFTMKPGTFVVNFHRVNGKSLDTTQDPSGGITIEKVSNETNS